MTPNREIQSAPAPRGTDPRVAVVACAVWDVTRAVDRPYGALGDDPVRGFADEDGAKVLALIEAAGLIVALPDEATVERVARELARQAGARSVDVSASYAEQYWHQFGNRARDILAALAPTGGPDDT